MSHIGRGLAMETGIFLGPPAPCRTLAGHVPNASQTHRVESGGSQRVERVPLFTQILNVGGIG